MSQYFPEFFSRWPAFLEELGAGPVVVAGHLRPDGDCIGSQIGLARTLRAMGIRAVCANSDSIPRRLGFISAEETFHDAGNLPDPGAPAVFVDCADEKRCGGKLAALFPEPMGNIDHHISNQAYARHNFVDSQAAATTEILAGIFLDSRLPIDPVSAQALYVGIVTDTGQFRFPSTTRRVFQICSELVERGADPAIAGFELYERESAGRINLLKDFLSSFRRECGGRVCLGILPEGIFDRTGATSEDTEGLVDYARSIEGVDIGVLIEQRGDEIKASLRAKDASFRVDRIAARFGGGGHAGAAGLNTRGSLDEFYNEMVEALCAHLKELDGDRDS